MVVPRREDLPHPREIAAALAARAADVCRYYLRGGIQAGAYWQAGDITGAAGQSLYVHLSGPRAGRWRDTATGDHGDLLDLIRLNGNHASLGPALREARAFLGGRYDIPEPAPAERAAATRGTRAADPERIGRFLASASPVRPDNAAGRHLAGRGLSPELAAETLLHHPRARVRVGDALVTSPAILAPIRTPDGRIEAVHRIFITEAGGPAEFAGRKRNFGAPAKGGVWFGAKAPARVVICEGIEDALAIYGQLSGSGRTRVAVVASASADRIAAVDMPDTVRDLVLFRDLDEAGARSWQALETRWRDSDIRLVCIAPDGGEGKDANDILLARGADVLRRRLADALGPDVEGMRETVTDENHEQLGQAGLLVEFVQNVLAKELAGLGVVGASVRITDGLPDHVRGRYLAGVIEIALADRETMRGALRHETVHALRALGGLKGRPWEILESRARRDWMHLVGDRYAELPEERRTEEAVAEAYRLWHDKKLDPPDKPRKVFEAVLRVLNRIRDWCRDYRWSRVEDVFGAIERGEFLVHAPHPDVTGKPPVRVAAIESTWGGLPIRKARKEARGWANGNIRGEYKNGDMDWHIEVGDSGIGKSVRKESHEDLEVLRALPALLESAIRYETELPFKKTRRNKGVRAFHHFLGATVLDGELRRIRLTVREYEDGRRFYDHCSVGESVPWRHVRREQGQTLASTPALPRHAISVKDLFAGVKYRNGDLQECPTLPDCGRFRSVRAASGRCGWRATVRFAGSRPSFGAGFGSGGAGCRCRRTGGVAAARRGVQGDRIAAKASLRRSAKRRVAEAMPSEPVLWMMTASARLAAIALFPGAKPVRARHASSPKTVSRTWWWASTAQCPRFQARSCCGEARSADTEVMPQACSTAVSPVPLRRASVRSRVTRKIRSTWGWLIRRGCGVRVVMRRRSMRPWALSMSSAKWPLPSSSRSMEARISRVSGAFPLTVMR